MILDIGYYNTIYMHFGSVLKGLQCSISTLVILVIAKSKTI